MAVNRPFRDEQPVGDLPVGKALRDQAGHFQLSVAEPRRGLLDGAGTHGVADIELLGRGTGMGTKMGSFARYWEFRVSPSLAA